MRWLLRKTRQLLLMTKPKQLALLMVTMYGAYFAAGGPLDLAKLSLLFLVGLGSAGGVTALNMYLERDIDSIMSRTRGRPLPSGELRDFEALLGVVLLIIAGTLAASFINRWVMLATLIGLYFDIVAYTELFKRHTQWAMMAGSVAGSMPALGGWAAGSGSVGLPGVLLAAMVFVWQPLHVAFIHYSYRDDYRVAGIPTIPDCLGERGYGMMNIVSIAGLMILVWLYTAIVGYGFLTSILASLLGVRALLAVRGFLADPSRESARRIVKMASPMIGMVFVFLPLEKYVLGIVGV